MSLTFLPDNRIIGATLSMVLGTENAQFPLTNIEKDFTTKVFRSNETTIEILVDLQATATIDAFAIVGSSSTGLGFTTISIQGSGSTDFSGSPVITIDMSAEHNFGFKLFTGVAFRFWKLSITRSSGSYIELSNIYLGSKSQLDQNGLSSASFSYINMSNAKISRNRFGQKFIDRYNNINEIAGDIEFCNSAEFDLIDAVYLQHGTTTPLWVIPDPDGTLASDGEFLFSGYYYFADNPEWTSVTTGLFNTSITLTEAT